MKRYKSHSALNVLLNSVNDLVGHFLVSHMSPPDKYVGVVKNLVSKSALLVVKRRASDFYIIIAQKGRYVFVKSARIKLTYFWIFLFMLIFVPNSYLYYFSAPLYVFLHFPYKIFTQEREAEIVWVKSVGEEIVKRGQKGKSVNVYKSSVFRLCSNKRAAVLKAPHRLAISVLKPYGRDYHHLFISVRVSQLIKI